MEMTLNSCRIQINHRMGRLLQARPFHPLFMVSPEGVGGGLEEGAPLLLLQLGSQGGRWGSPSRQRCPEPQIVSTTELHVFYSPIYIPEENMRDSPGDPVIPSAGGQVPHLAQELDPTCCN